jgi:chemotaxis regulatin CheY-phosphate phosphatase CheZ
MARSRSLTTISEADFDVIERAVTETERGRWFLAEYARRNRHADTTMLLDAIGRVENAVAGERMTGGVDRLRGDLMEMARAIARTKSEIAALHDPSQDQGRLTTASETLDGIVRQTERATSDILEAAEHIQETAWTLREGGHDGPLCDELDRRATQIYTACSFQDLTAQRTSRIVATLRYLETRLAAMIEIWGGEETAPAPAPQAEVPPASDLSQSDIDLVIDTQGAPHPVPAPTVAPAAVEPTAVIVDDVAFVLKDEVNMRFDLPPAPERATAEVTPLPTTLPLAQAFADLDAMSDAEKLRRFT